MVRRTRTRVLAHTGIEDDASGAPLRTGGHSHPRAPSYLLPPLPPSPLPLNNDRQSTSARVYVGSAYAIASVCCVDAGVWTCAGCAEVTRGGIRGGGDSRETDRQTDRGTTARAIQRAHSGRTEGGGGRPAGLEWRATKQKRQAPDREKKRLKAKDNENARETLCGEVRGSAGVKAKRGRVERDGTRAEEGMK